MNCGRVIAARLNWLHLPREANMNEDTLNMEIRKFLKKVGVTSQREIEHAVEKAVEKGQLAGTRGIQVKMTLEAPELGIKHCIEDTIALE